MQQRVDLREHLPRLAGDVGRRIVGDLSRQVDRARGAVDDESGKALADVPAFEVMVLSCDEGAASGRTAAIVIEMNARLAARPRGRVPVRRRGARRVRRARAAREARAGPDGRLPDGGAVPLLARARSAGRRPPAAAEARQRRAGRGGLAARRRAGALLREPLRCSRSPACANWARSRRSAAWRSLPRGRRSRGRRGGGDRSSPPLNRPSRPTP